MGFESMPNPKSIYSPQAQEAQEKVAAGVAAKQFLEAHKEERAKAEKNIKAMLDLTLLSNFEALTKGIGDAAKIMTIANDTLDKFEEVKKNFASLPEVMSFNGKQLTEDMFNKQLRNSLEAIEDRIEKTQGLDLIKQRIKKLKPKEINNSK